MGEAMQAATATAAAAEIGRQLANLLGAQLDGPFRLIRYPPGFNYNVQYGASAYWNPKTFALIDQLCSLGDDGTAAMTGASFSGLFAQVMGSTGYGLSTADTAAAQTATDNFETLEGAMIESFERNFGRVSKKQISASGAKPPTKTGYIMDYVAKNFPGVPAAIPPAYADFAVRHSRWLSAGAQLEHSAAVQQTAEDSIVAAAAHVTAPDASNGGMQTDAATVIPAWRGLPDPNTIVASLSDPARTATLQFVLKSDATNALRLTVGDKDVGALDATDLTLRLGSTTTQADLWTAADRIDMSVAYTGLTILRADPLELSADRKSGWFSRLILSDIATKTGKDATGFRLTDQGFDVTDLFAPGHRLSRVQTLVISREPTVSLTFHGSGIDALATSITPAQAAEVDLGGWIGFGGAGGQAYAVQNVTRGQDTITLTLSPPPPVGTTPPIDQTAHLLGGVVDSPP
jgi:hypothetical protein